MREKHSQLMQARAFNNGEEEKCLSIIAEREAKREQIRLLELQI